MEMLRESERAAQTLVFQGGATPRFLLAWCHADGCHLFHGVSGLVKEIGEATEFETVEGCVATLVAMEECFPALVSAARALVLVMPPESDSGVATLVRPADVAEMIAVRTEALRDYD